MKVRVTKTTAVQASLSILFAFILFFMAQSRVFQQNNSSLISSRGSKTTVNDVPISFIYNEDKYIIDSKVTTANVTVSSDNKILLERAKENVSISIDLREKEAGVQYQFLLADNIDYLNDVDSNLEFKITPESITVGLIEAQTQVFEIEVDGYQDFIDSSKGEPVARVSLSEVEVRGATTDIERISRVVAFVHPEEIISSDYTEEVMLYALDEEGESIDDVTFATEKVAVTITSESITKEVPIRVTIKNGENVKSNLNDDTVTITGPQDAIDKISEVTATIDASNVKEDQTVTAELEVDNDAVSLEENEIEVELKVDSK